MTPRRIQLSRRKGYRKPKNAVVASRPSKWGNPYTLSYYRFAKADGTPVPHDEQAAREMAVRDFEHALRVGMLKITVEDVRRELRGKSLACWCPLPKAGAPDVCHAAVLLEIANDGGPT